MNGDRAQLTCLYRGEPVTGVAKGEHVIPYALGGSVTIRNVCKQCNEGQLHKLDDQFVTNSWMNVIASQELKKPLTQCWYKEEALGNLLLEAEPVWRRQELESVLVWPQFILYNGEPVMRLDAEQISEPCNRGKEFLLAERVKEACRLYLQGDRQALIPHRIGKSEVYSDCQYPPKLFVRRRLANLGTDMTVFLGYVEGEDPEELVKLIDTRSILRDFDRSPVVHGSTQAIVGPKQFPFYLLRAFTKYAINVLSKVCKHTRVDHTTFPGPIDYIFENARAPEGLEAACGFVYAADMEGFACPSLPRSHSGRSSALGPQQTTGSSGRLLSSSVNVVHCSSG